MELSEWVRTSRENLHISQGKLSRLLCLDASAVSKWETGVNIPTMENIEKLEKLFDSQAPSLNDVAQGFDYCSIDSANELGLKVEIKSNQDFVKAECCLNEVSFMALDFAHHAFKDPAVQAEFAVWLAKGGAERYAD